MCFRKRLGADRIPISLCDFNAGNVWIFRIAIVIINKVHKYFLRNWVCMDNNVVYGEGC